MGEDDESFATNAVYSCTSVPSVNQDSFLELLVKCYYQNLLDPRSHKSVVTGMLITLVTMKLNLPENAEARESISRTNIIKCLVITMATPKFHHRACRSLDVSVVVYVARLMGDLISGSHTENIKECYKCGALPVLVDNLSSEYGGHCARVLKKLRIDDNPQHNPTSLLDFSSVSTILNAMKARPDLHEWGCSRLHYVLTGWEKHCPGEDAGEAFLKNGAIDAIVNAIIRIPTATILGPAPAPNPGSFGFGQAPAPVDGEIYIRADGKKVRRVKKTATLCQWLSNDHVPDPAYTGFGQAPASTGFGQAPAPASSTGGFTVGSAPAPAPATIREACKCILILVSKSPGIRSYLLKKGAVTFLGATLQKQWPKHTIDVHGHCQQALLAVLGSPM
jgi:hypothetical protein